MIKTALELAGRIRPEIRVSPEEMKRRLDDVLEVEYGIKRSQSQQAVPAR
jgi:hypothetical protein